MADAMYPKAKQRFLSGAISVLAGTWKAVVVDLADYTYNAAHEFLSDIPVGARVATTAALTMSLTGASIDFTAPTLSSVTGDQAEAIVLYLDTGSAATSPLVFFKDTGLGGFPYTPSGNDLDISTPTTAIDVTTGLPFYTSFLNGLLQGQYDLTTLVVRAMAIDTAQYTASAAHQFLSDVPAGARKGVGTLTGKAVTNGVFTAASLSLGSPAGPEDVEALTLYVDDAGADSVKRLIMTRALTATRTLNGTPATVTWSGSVCSPLG